MKQITYYVVSYRASLRSVLDKRRTWYADVQGDAITGRWSHEREDAVVFTDLADAVAVALRFDGCSVEVA